MPNPGTVLGTKVSDYFQNAWDPWVLTTGPGPGSDWCRLQGEGSGRVLSAGAASFSFVDQFSSCLGELSGPALGGLPFAVGRGRGALRFQGEGFSTGPWSWGGLCSWNAVGV